jgi:hypothetical protein
MTVANDPTYGVASQFFDGYLNRWPNMPDANGNTDFSGPQQMRGMKLPVETGARQAAAPRVGVGRAVPREIAERWAMGPPSLQSI